MLKAVFDCNIFAQALINPVGPAGTCVEAALDGHVTLFLADFAIAEIRGIAEKPTPASLGVTPQKIDALIELLLVRCEFLSSFPVLFTHPIDKDDSDYVNLALAAGAKLIVSRDRHLLNLHNAAKPWSADFRSRFPDLRVINPEAFLAEVRQDPTAPSPLKS